jgi:hypothetical protein
MRSYKLADTVLLTEKQLRKQVAKDKVFKTDSKGNIIKNKFNQNFFTDEYATQFHEALNGMVENQIRAAIVCVSSYWYTAWVNAGKPTLDDLDPAYINEQNKERLQSELKKLKYGKLLGIESEKEF